MKALDDSNRRHVEAAEGWLGLGVWEEGKNELMEIPPEARAHPDVIRIAMELLAARGEWSAVAEDALALCVVEPENATGWFFRAAALNRMDRTVEARALLLGVVERFPGMFPLYYSLVSYCCRLGKMEEARRWWKKTVAFNKDQDLVEMAREDPDFREFWKSGIIAEEDEGI